jgi:hypothetical protein
MNLMRHDAGGADIPLPSKMSTPSFLIFMQRKDDAGDDVIRITRANIDNSRFRISYIDESVKLTPRVMYLTESETLEYVWMLVNGLSLDKDPFEYFQITPPASPSIQFEVADLKNTGVQQAIHSTLKFALRHWVAEEIQVARRVVMNPEDSDEDFRTPIRRNVRPRTSD